MREPRYQYSIWFRRWEFDSPTEAKLGDLQHEFVDAESKLQAAQFLRDKTREGEGQPEIDIIQQVT